MLASLGVLSPGFDPNDAGFQYGPSDVVQMQFVPGYQWTKPGKVFLYSLVAGGVFRSYDFGGNKIWDGGLAMFQGQFRNFWQVDMTLGKSWNTWDDKLTRGGPTTIRPGIESLTLVAYSDTRRRFWMSAMAALSNREFGSRSRTYRANLNLRPWTALTLSATPCREILSGRSV